VVWLVILLDKLLYVTEPATGYMVDIIINNGGRR